MIIDKYIVLVTSNVSSYAAQELTKGTFRIMIVPTFDAASALVRAFHKLCLVIIDDSVDLANVEQFYCDTHASQHSLPIVLISDSAEESSRVGGQQLAGPEYKFRSIPSTEELEELLNRDLRASSYSDEFVSCLTQSSIESLKGFRMATEPSAPYLSACRVRLEELNAILSFSGSQAAGHLIVRGSRHLMQQSVARFLEQTQEPISQSQQVDTLGELANRILGTTLAFFERRGTPVHFGLPVYVDGRDGQVWDEHHVSTLGIEFHSLDGTLAVECSLAKLGEPAESKSRRSHQILDSEDGTLFL